MRGTDDRRAPPPDQDFPVLIVRYLFGVDQFRFQIFQILIIQLEAPFQRAVSAAIPGQPITC